MEVEQFPLLTFIRFVLINAIDFRPSNIMLRMTGLDGTSEDELLKIIGEPARAPLTTTTGKKHACPSAPQYLVRPVRFHLLSNLHYITDQACLIDFGQSYEASHPPDDLGIPTPYQSPEFVLERAVGQPSDIWALGNTLFEIRTGQKLFRPFDDDPDQYLSGMVKILGKLPERWWRKIWRNRSAFFLDDPDDQGNPVETHPVKLNGSRPRSLRTKIAAFGMEYEMSPVGCPGAPDICDKIPETEIAVFADLLSKLLRYEPHERISAREALDHEWFRIDGTKHDMMQGVSDEAIYLEDFISAARQSMRSEQSASITHGFVGGGRERKDIPPELC
jgi:serine/threonine protein kinase